MTLWRLYLIMPKNEKDFENGMPVGFSVANWKGCERPPRTAMQGRFAAVEPLDIDRHGEDLFQANRLDTDDKNWTYLNSYSFDNFESYQAWLESSCLGDDPLVFAIIDLKTKKAVGVASYMRIDPKNGVIEVGGINYSPALQRTAAGTEAMYLMMKRAFDELGYRRYEWKCDDHNAASKRAAVRYGFIFEGIFRQAIVTKGRNRDTAWFSIIDKDWPTIKTAFEAWLSAKNLSDDGQQEKALGVFLET